MSKYNTLPSNITKDRVLSNEKTLILKVTQNDQTHVMKIFPSSKEYLFNNEYNISSSLSHQNILSITSGSKHDDSILPYFYTLSPFCSNGTLYQLLINKIRFQEKELRTYFHQLVGAIEHMHDKEIYHLDLKPCNILIDDEYQFRVFDFDLSLKKGEKLNSRGTPNYRAPELIKGKQPQHFDKCDVYSLGVLLFTMHNGCREPFLEKEDVFYWKRHIFDKDTKQYWEEIRNFFSQFMKIEWSDDLKELIEGMLLKDPSKRMSLKEVKESKWYNGEVWTNDELKVLMKSLMIEKYTKFE